MSKNNVRLANFVRKVKMQKQIEQYFGEHNISKDIIEEFQQTPVIVERVQQGVALLTEWLNGEYYSSKQARLAQVAILDLEAIVYKTVTTIAMKCTQFMPLVSVASLLAHQLKFADQRDGILTMTEIIAVLADIDLYDLDRANKFAQISVKTRIELSDELKERAQNSRFLPPLLHRPAVLRNNRHSGYTTLRGDSLILGGFQNHHDNHISLDVLNTLNRNQFEIDEEFISTIDEQPSAKVHNRLDEWEEDYDELSREEKEMYELEKNNWQQYKEQCYVTYSLMLRHGNKFYFQHKVDKRGRVYTYGYHLNPQGNSFKKAMLNLAHKEVATGVEDFLGECK